MLSTGNAADSTDAAPDFYFAELQAFNTDDANSNCTYPACNGTVIGNNCIGDIDALCWGRSHSSSSGYPAGFNINPGPGCPLPADTTEVYDPIALNLQLRAPTNAQSFSVDIYFFSAEYPEWVCTAYNDFFVALIDSASPNNPADGNLAFYQAGADTYPVGVNLVQTAGGLFSVCEDALAPNNGGLLGICDTGNTPYADCDETLVPFQLTGTGFDNAPGYAPTSGCADGINYAGGATGWLRLTGNVVPGEVFDLTLATWDSGDASFDSTVLLDNWTWSVDPAVAGVTPG